MFLVISNEVRIRNALGNRNAKMRDDLTERRIAVADLTVFILTVQASGSLLEFKQTESSNQSEWSQ